MYILPHATKKSKGLLKASHHANIMSQHIEHGTTPRGLQANVTTQIPEISTSFQMRWERAHINFANALTNLLQEYWTTRTADLTTTCKNNEMTEINLLLSKITLNPTTVNKSERKVEDTRNHQFLRVPPRTQSSTSVKRRYHSLLDKGLSLCPTLKPNHPCHTLRDVYIFNRLLPLKHHFLVSTSTREKTMYSDFTPLSGWTPPLGKDLYIDSFIGNFNNHVNTDRTHTPIT